MIDCWLSLHSESWIFLGGIMSRKDVIFFSYIFIWMISTFILFLINPKINFGCYDVIWFVPLIVLIILKYIIKSFANWLEEPFLKRKNKEE